MIDQDALKWAKIPKDGLSDNDLKPKPRAKSKKKSQINGGLKSAVVQIKNDNNNMRPLV